MKKVLSLLLALMLLLSCACMPAMAEEEGAISVLLDGQYVEFDVAPTIVEGRTLVPLRAIFEALGAVVHWEQETQTVMSVKNDVAVGLQIGNSTLFKNGEEITLDVPAQLIDNRTLVPVRAISEAFGCYVAWNEWTRTVLVVSDLDKTPVAVVNDDTVSVGYFNYILTQLELSAMQNMGLSPEDIKTAWNENSGGVTFSAYIAEATLNQCIYTKANARDAKASGVVLTEADMKDVDSRVSATVAMYAGAEAEDSAASLKAIGMTESSIKEFYTDNMYVEKYAERLLSSSMSDAEAKKFLDENYVKAKHILISTMDDFTGQPLSEEEKAEKKKLAEQILSKIRNGASFDKLIAEYGEDPGMTQSPDGYLFTDGEMVEEFETAVKNLGVGEVSGIVESAYGYHIIKRVGNGEYTADMLAQVKSSLSSSTVIDAFNSNLQAAIVATNNAILSEIIPLFD